MNYQEALDYLERMTRGKINTTEQYHNDKSSFIAIKTLQELIDKCVFINEEWKTKNNIQGTFLIETPTDRTCLPQGVDYE